MCPTTIATSGLHSLPTVSIVVISSASTTSPCPSADCCDMPQPLAFKAPERCRHIWPDWVANISNLHTFRKLQFTELQQDRCAWNLFTLLGSVKSCCLHQCPSLHTVLILAAILDVV